MYFFNSDLTTYIEPKNETAAYRNKLEETNLFPLPSRLIYTPIMHPELMKRIEKSKISKIPSLYSNISTFVLENNILFSQGLIGAPATGILIEEFIALGIEEIFFLGLAGGIQKVSFGDLILVTEAIRLEGTSFHYFPKDHLATPSSVLLEEFELFLANKNVKFTKNKICSIDAPFRETFSLVNNLRKDDVLGIEMEISAVYSIAKFRKIKALAIVIISDLLNDHCWSKFQPQEFFESFLSCYDHLLEFLNK